MKLSIIIPVFNAERYLGKCLESVFDQDLQVLDFEVIVINDGSTDDSEQIILRYSSRHHNLLYLKQTNKGVSVARNAGLELAKGEYITFVDSDDQIEKDSLKKIIEKLETDSLDILYPLIDTYSESGERLDNIGYKGLYDEIKRGILQERRTFPPTFYRKELVKDFRFNPRISFGEDTVFNAKAQALADRVAFVNIPYYRYTVRENSLSKQGRTRKVFKGLLLAITEVRAYQQQHFNNMTESEDYFDKIYEIFVTRILELNIMPQWNRENYNEIVTVLADLNLIYILNRLSAKYPHVGTSFRKFKAYQQYLGFKSTIHQLLYRG